MKTYMEIVLTAIAIATLVTSEFINGALLIALKYRQLKSMQVSFIRRLSVCYMLYGAIFGLVVVISMADNGHFFATETINCALQGILSDALNIFIAWQMLLLSIERYSMIKMDDIPPILKKHSGVIQGSIVVASLTYALSIGCHLKSYQYIPNLYRCSWSIQGVPLAVYVGIGILPSILSLFVTLLMISVPFRIRRLNSVMPQNTYQISIVEEERNRNNISNNNPRMLNDKFRRSASAALFSIPASILLIAPFLFHFFDRGNARNTIFYYIWNFLIPSVCLFHPCMLLLRNKKMVSLLKRFFCCKLVALEEKKQSFRILFHQPLEARESTRNRLGQSSPTGEYSFHAEITTSSGNVRKNSSMVTKIHNMEKSDSDSKNSSLSTKITTHAEVHNSSSILKLSRSSNASSVCTKVESHHPDILCNSLQSNKSSLSSQMSFMPGAAGSGRRVSTTNSIEYGNAEYLYRTSGSSNTSSSSSVIAKITIQKSRSTIQISTASNSPDISATLGFDTCSPSSLSVNFEDITNTSPSIASPFECIQIKRYSQSI